MNPIAAKIMFLGALSSAMIFFCMSGVTRSQEQAKPLIQDYVNAAIGPVPESLKLDPFYRKYTDALGISIVGSDKAPSAALLVARDIVIHMLAKRPDLREEMIKRKMRVGVRAQSESTTDVPEQKNWKKPSRDDPRLTPSERNNYDNGIAKMTDKEYWDKRARGMGGNPTTCAEENLLGYPETRYYGENILVHEFSHNIMGALRTADPDLYKEIGVAYDSAKSKGMYTGQYAINTVAEYWAEGTQWWFWSNFEFYDGPTRVQTPEDLKAYDPRLYAILDRVYLDHHVPADVYYSKNVRPARRTN